MASTVKCVECEERFEPCKMETHIATSHLGDQIYEPFQCECGQEFIRKCEAMIHFAEVHYPAGEYPDILVNSVEWKEDEILRIAAESGVFIKRASLYPVAYIMCDTCDELVRSKRIEHHISVAHMHGYKPYKCRTNRCLIDYASVGQLQHHWKYEHPDAVIFQFEEDKRVRKERRITKVAKRSGVRLQRNFEPPPNFMEYV